MAPRTNSPSSQGARRLPLASDPRPRARGPRRSAAQPGHGLHLGRARSPRAARPAALGTETLDEQVARCYEQFRASGLRRRTSGSSSPSSTTATRCCSTGSWASTSTRCCRSSTRRRSVRPSSSSATCSAALVACSSPSMTSTASTGPWTPPGSDRTTSTCSSPPTPRRSSASATGASVGSTSPSASSRSTRSPPGSTRGGCWLSGWTSAPTAKSFSTTRATSACAAPGYGASEYDAFIDAYVASASARFPNAILHWEDFSGPPARGILARYGDTLCTFDDDIQGTAAVGLACALAGVRVSGGRLDRSADRRLRRRLGRRRYRRPDRAGHDRGRSERAGGGRPDLPARPSRAAHQRHDRPVRLPAALRQGPGSGRRLARRGRAASGWRRWWRTSTRRCWSAPPASPEPSARRSSARCTRTVRGRSSCPCPTRPCWPSRPRRTCSRGPTARRWSRPAVPFEPVERDGTTYRIGQANNALMFPGLGLGVIVCRAATMPPSLFIAAARALAKLADPTDPAEGLLPDISRLREVSATVAVDVVSTATAAGHRPGPGRRPDRGGPRGDVDARLPPDQALTTAPDLTQEQQHGPDGGGDPGRPDGGGRDPEGVRDRR